MTLRRPFAPFFFVALVAASSFATGRWVLASEGPEAPSPSVAITRADDGKTIVLRVGDRFLLHLAEEFNWIVAVSDASIVKRVAGGLVIRGAQGIYEAERAGEIDVTATGVLNCAPYQPCPALATVFRAHISVRSTLPYRVTLSQLARDGADASTFVVTGIVLAGPTCPVERIPPDPRCADRPVSGAEILFVNGAGDSVGDALSDADGRFSIALPAGRYTLTPQLVRGLLGTAAPQLVVITDADIEVTLRYDTGIR